MINQMQPLCTWIIANEHTGEDIDNKVLELGGTLPPEMLNMVPGVTYDDGFLIINFPPKGGDVQELVYGFGIRMSAMSPGIPESLYLLVPNDSINNPILTSLDLDTGALLFEMM